METIAAPAPEPQSQAPNNHFGRLTGALFNPKATFADIAQRPSWVAPFLLLCALALVVSGLLGQKTDWRSFFERQMSQNSRLDQMPQQQKDQMLENQVKWAPKVSYVFGIVFTAGLVLFLALVYWGAFNLFNGAGLRYRTAFGITCHAFVPILISSVLAIIILLLKARGDVDPEHFLVTNVGAFLPEDASHWLQVLGQSLDLFWIWTLILVAIGFGAANPKKIKPGTAYGTVFGLWLLWVLVRTGLAAL
jgi:hypothetical protein